MKKLIFSIILSTFFSFSFSQLIDISPLPFNRAKMLFNPALTGSQSGRMIGAHMINKWPALGSTYSSQIATYEQKIDRLKSGLGLSFINDVQGDGAYHTINLNLHYSYHMPLSKKWNLKAGTYLGYYKGSFNWDFFFGPSTVPLSSINDKIEYFNIGLGILVSNTHFIGGFAMGNLTKPDVSYNENYEEKLDFSYALNLGYKIMLMDNFSILPLFYFNQERDDQKMKIGTELRYKWVMADIFYGKQFKFHYDGIAFGMGYQSKRFGVMYNYELTISKLSNQTLGIHMLSLNYLFGKK